MWLTATNDEGSGMTSQRTRERLVQQLAAAGIKNQQVLDVMRRVPRHLFIDEALASRAYDDSALPIGHGQTISHPLTVARMTEAVLEGHECSTILEVGTGSGFQTAVLAALVRRVYSIERLEVLAREAALRLRSLKLRNVRLRYGDGHYGWSEFAPYDGILVAAAASGVPRQLADQLVCGGHLVLPIDNIDHQILVRVTRTSNGFKQEVLGPATFVPLVGGIG